LPGTEQLLLSVLTDRADEVRIQAARALGHRHAQAAAPTLERWLGDGEARIRAAGAEALGELCAAQSPVACGRRVLPPLVRLLADGDGEVRGAAVAALVRVGSRDAVPALTGRLEDGNVGVRRAAAAAPGELGDARAVLPLIARLVDSS